MKLSETLEAAAGSSEAGTETLETNTETQTQGYTFTDDLIYGIAGGLQHCRQCLCWKHEIRK